MGSCRSRPHLRNATPPSTASQLCAGRSNRVWSALIDLTKGILTLIRLSDIPRGWGLGQTASRTQQFVGLRSRWNSIRFVWPTLRLRYSLFICGLDIAGGRGLG